MKTITTIKGAMLMTMFVGTAMVSCTAESESPATGTGTMALTLETQSEFASTRAVTESDYKNLANYTVQVTDRDGNVREEFMGNEIPGMIELPIGSYTVTATCGEEKVASRNTFLSTGSSPVNIGSDSEEKVTVTCAPTCGKAAVKFDETMADYYTDYYVEYTTPALGQGKVVWAKADQEPWYLAVSEQGDDVVATIHLAPKPEYLTDEQKTSGYAEGVITKQYNLKRNKAWTMNIKPNYSTSIGQLGISITVDESTNDTEVPITVPSEWIVK